jgi:uncharacterized membrane protein YhaH (DUF805 family)
MHFQRLIWNFLKRMLVREGRSSRKDFLIYGALPLYLSLFAQLLIPAFPEFGDFGLLLLASSAYFSRVALAQAIRRCHDMGLSDEWLKSLKHQVGAYVQAFLVMLVVTAFQQVNSGSPTAFVFAAVGAALIVASLLGGPKAFRALATTVGSLMATRHGETPEDTMAAFGIYSAEKQRVDPYKAKTAKLAARPATPALRLTMQSSDPPVRRVLKVPQTEPASVSRPKAAPQQPQAITVRRRPRNAIGEWSQDGR